MNRTGGKNIYNTDYSEYLPAALQQDPKIKTLAATLAKELLDTSRIINNVLIYSRIDELPEALVDILAYDMHIDWYDYSYPVEAKREILKSSVRVHKRMGTKYAIEKAMDGIHPGSEVEEWFEYGGEPHHFRIVCDMTGSRIAASYADIVTAVSMYKRLSSHLQEVIYQARIKCLLTAHTDYFKYSTPVAGRIQVGTHPQRNRKGVQRESVFVVGSESAGFAFTAPQTGTKPERNMLFRAAAAQINTETELQGYMYSTPQAGTKPERNTLFRQTAAQIGAETALDAHRYKTVQAGRKNAGEVPQRNTQGVLMGTKVENTTETDNHTYSAKMCGSKRRL